MWQSARTEQLVVGNISEQHLVQSTILGQAVRRPDPYVFNRLLRLRMQNVDRIDGPKFERPSFSQEASHLFREFGREFPGDIGNVGQALRTWHIGHRSLMLDAILGMLEGCREIEDGAAVLDRNNATRREATTITGPVDFVDDRRSHVAAAQKIRVQRVHDAVLDRVLGRRQRLTENLSTKHLRTADVPAIAPKYILLDALEPKQPNQVLEYRMHQSTGFFRPPSTFIPVPLTNAASSLARKSTTLATSKDSPSRCADDVSIQ